jgi:hypothetical protein
VDKQFPALRHVQPVRMQGPATDFFGPFRLPALRSGFHAFGFVPAPGSETPLMTGVHPRPGLQTGRETAYAFG